MGRLRTLGDAISAGTYIHVICLRCRHESYFDPEDLYRYFGGARAVEAIRFHCSPRLGGCGGRWYDVEFQALGPTIMGRAVRAKPQPLRVDQTRLGRLAPGRPIRDPRR